MGEVRNTKNKKCGIRLYTIEGNRLDGKTHYIYELEASSKRIVLFVQIEHLESEGVLGSSVKVVQTILVYTQENVFDAITR